MAKKLRKKVVKRIVYAIPFFLIVIMIGLFMSLSSNKLIYVIDKNIELSINSEVYNTDCVKNINNGTLKTSKKAIDTSKLGTQTYKLIIEDKFNKTHEVKIKVTIYDKEAPTIEYKESLTTEEGTNIDLLKDVKVVDNSKEEIEVKVEGEYDINKPNTYKLYYVAKDSSNNETRKEFTLKVTKKKVVETPQAPVTPTPQDKTFTTSKGFKGVVKNGITYIDGYMIANKTYALPSTYKPGRLTAETQAAFNKMKAAAKLDGLNLRVASGYRSYSTQKSLYNNYVNRDGKAAADTYSARPGHSEHQTGLGADINSPQNPYISDRFHNTPEAKWLASNSYKYGFILRYPKGKTNETGYKYESWHFRYVGTELAEKLYNNGDWITLESYFGITSIYS